MNGFESSNNSGRASALLAGTVNMTDMSHPGVLLPLLGLEQNRDAVRKELNRDAMRWLKLARRLLAGLWRLAGRQAASYPGLCVEVGGCSVVHWNRLGFGC